MCMCIWGGQKTTLAAVPWASSSFVWSQGLSLKLELIVSARLVKWWAPRIHLSLSSHTKGYSVGHHTGQDET